MNSDIVDNKYVLLNQKPKYNSLIIFSLLLFLLIIFSSIYYKTYDSFKVTGIYVNKEISITLNSSDVKKIIESEFIKINARKYKVSILSVSQPDYDWTSNVSYQTIILTTSEKFYNNEILEITFYRNKQRIIRKVFNLLKWKGRFMKTLQASELHTINGGAVKKSLVFGLIAIGVLVAGIIDGLLRPLRCN